MSKKKSMLLIKYLLNLIHECIDILKFTVNRCESYICYLFEFHKLLHPNAVFPVKIDGMPVPRSQLNTLLAFFAIFTLMLLFTATLMISVGIDMTNALTIALSCVSNVGLTLSTQIGPEMSWSELPDYVKWLCSFLMLVGRLEIMSVLVLFTRAFWRDN